MTGLLKLVLKIAINALILYGAKIYLSGFILGDGTGTLIIGALVLTILNVFVRPILRLISTPLIWITFGLFNIVIYVAILWIADQLLTQLIISDTYTLVILSVILGIANSII